MCTKSMSHVTSSFAYNRTCARFRFYVDGKMISVFFFTRCHISQVLHFQDFVPMSISGFGYPPRKVACTCPPRTAGRISHLNLCDTCTQLGVNVRNRRMGAKPPFGWVKWSSAMSSRVNHERDSAHDEVSICASTSAAHNYVPEHM